MFHVVTVHWRNHDWIEPQLRAIECSLPAGTRVYASLNGIDRHWWSRPWLRLRETTARIRRTGAPFALAMVLLLIAAAALAFALWPDRLSVATGGRPVTTIRPA